MIQKMLKLFLILICSLPLKGEITTSTLDDFSCDNDTYAQQLVNRGCHCNIRTRQLKVCDTATIGKLDVLCNETVGGDLTVLGNVSVSGNQETTGNQTIINDLDVANDLFITGSLIVDGIDFALAITGAENVCTDTSTQLYVGTSEDGHTLQFRCLKDGYNITLTPDENSITISTTSTTLVTPVLTTTVTGGILAYAAAYNYNNAQTIVTGAPVLFSDPSGIPLDITEPAAGNPTFTLTNPGTYYFEYHVRGTPGATALVPPAPLAFQLRANGIAIAASQFASDTQISSLASDVNGGTLAVNGFVIATIPAGATTIDLQNITGYDVILSADAQQGTGVSPLLATPAISASLIIERIA